MKLKIAIVSVMLLFLLPVASAQTNTTITTPSEDLLHERNTDLTVEWDSEQDHTTEDTLKESTITVEDESGTSYEETIQRGTTVQEGNSISESVTLSSSDLSPLQNGTWSVSVDDTWNDTSTDTDLTRSDTISIQGGVYGNVSLTIVPFEEYTRNTDLSVEWTVENNMNVDQILENTDITIDGGDGNTVSDTITHDLSISSGSSESLEINFSTSETDSLSDGTWTVSITDSWTYNTTTETATLAAMSESTGKTLTIDSPNSGTNHTFGDDLEVEWTSENNNANAKLLETSTVTVEDEIGRSYSKDISRDTSVDGGNSVTYTETIASSNLSDLDTGAWTITLTDTWEDNSKTESIEITAESSDIAFSTTIGAPESNEDIQLSPDNREFTVEFTVQNDKTAQEVQNDLELTDSSGNRITAARDTDFTAEEQRTLSYTFDHSQLEQLSLPDSWTLSVESTGVDSNAEDTASVTFQVEELAENDVTVDITNIADGDTLNLQEANLEVQPSASFENIGSSATLDLTYELTDGTETATESLSTSFGQDESKSFQQTFDHETLTDFDTDSTWTLTVSADKPDASASTSVDFDVSVVQDENETTDFDDTDNQTDDTDDTTDETDDTDESTGGVAVAVNTDTEQTIDPDDRSFDVSYAITNNNATEETIDVTTEVSDGTITVEQTSQRSFQAGETRSLSETFTHETLSALDMDETWEITVTAADTQTSTTDDDVQTYNPRSQDGSNQDGDGSRTISGDGDDGGLPMIPIMVAVLILLVGGSIYLYRQTQ